MENQRKVSFLNTQRRAFISRPGADNLRPSDPSSPALRNERRHDLYYNSASTATWPRETCSSPMITSWRLPTSGSRATSGVKITTGSTRGWVAATTTVSFRQLSVSARARLRSVTHQQHRLLTECNEFAPKLLECWQRLRRNWFGSLAIPVRASQPQSSGTSMLNSRATILIRRREENGDSMLVGRFTPEFVLFFRVAFSNLTANSRLFRATCRTNGWRPESLTDHLFTHPTDV